MKHLSNYITEKYNSQSLLESGASGHMLHPQDVNDFTVEDIEELIREVFGGELQGMTEKMDGFGIQASMNHDGEVVFIRNKTQLNSEKGGMTIDDFPRQWDSNPTALKNYTKGAKIIEAVFKKIGLDWFNPDEKTRRVANCECILEGVTNTIPYVSDQVDFHNVWIYEWNGTEWVNTEVTKKGLDVIEKACQGIDKVQLTPNVIIKYSEETEKLKNKWLATWQKFIKDCDCGPGSTIESIKYSLFFKWIEKNLDWMMSDYKAAQDVCRRWLFGDKKSADVKDLKAIYQDHVDEFNKIDKSPSRTVNAVLFPLQKFFYGMGADVVKATSGLVNAGNDTVVKSLLKDLNDATEKIKREGSLEDNEFLQTWLSVLDEIGKENLSSAEGVVFSYKGKMMKFTGGFVPLNRIIGYSKYTMKPKSLQESLFDKDLTNKTPAIHGVTVYMPDWKLAEEFFKKRINTYFKKAKVGEIIHLGDMSDEYVVEYIGDDCLIAYCDDMNQLYVLSPETIYMAYTFTNSSPYSFSLRDVYSANDFECNFLYDTWEEDWYSLVPGKKNTKGWIPETISSKAKSIIKKYIK